MAVFKSRRTHKPPTIQEGREPFFNKQHSNNNHFFSSVSANSIQTKLTIGQPGDAFEREADAMADTVVNQNQTPQIQQQQAGMIQSAPMKEDEKINTKPELQMMEDKKEEEVQPKSESGASTPSPALSSHLQQTQGRGHPLPATTQAKMQSAFGRDFSDVQIHTDGESAQMNRELKAQAFTHGQDIYFNQGKFDPESETGEHLLAHELTHVVQQNQDKP
ncbi:DUF4157 domain-containing protein [Scytonema sp. UIC 10036]|uniref:eCIS core domain-containing protein n=1 Tax=Scytonema sp. UIC 10036 TaxID=2304196 RepID=UPI0012DA5B6F|nr:DUF4157 domain-containing protein [Scytonema sp. UIC 10036]